MLYYIGKQLDHTNSTNWSKDDNCNYLRWMRAGIVAVLIALVASELIMVQELFRHGARYPTTPNDKDGTSYVTDDDMAGQLTIEGKRMHYLLGMQLYKDYWTQLGLNSTYNSSYVYIKSTNVNRTLESGEAQFLGWTEDLDPLELNEDEAKLAFPPWETQDFNLSVGAVFPNSPKFKPMAIHSEKMGSNALNEGDFLIAYQRQNCPKAEAWAKEGYNSELYQNVSNLQRIKEALKAMQVALNDSIKMNKAAMYFENYMCSKHLLKPYNPVFDSEYQKDFMFMQSFVKYTDLASNEVQINATVTGFFNATIHNMEKVMANKHKEKLVLYSAHDLTIVMALAGLRMGSRECALNHYLSPQEPTSCVYTFPDFASSMVFELHLQAQSYFVRLRYNGEYMKFPFCSSSDCPYGEFKGFLTQTMRSTFPEDCGVDSLPQAPKETQLIVANAVIGAFLLGAVVYQIYLFTRKRKRAPIASPTTYHQQMDEA